MTLDDIALQCHQDIIDAMLLAIVNLCLRIGV